MPIHIKNNISYLSIDALDDLGIAHGFFMRHGGCSPKPWSSLNLATSVGDSREAVIENRKRITDILERDQNSIYDVWQVHSNEAVFSNVPRMLSTPHKKADAIITANRSVTLLMLFADCVPILLYDRRSNISAIAHAGWKGTINKVVSAAVEKMVKEHACNSKNIIACIGPSICVDHYAVGGEVVEKVKNSFVRTKRILIKKNEGYHLDLQEANKQNLLDVGVNEIHTSGICTACNTQDWFSHRAEKGNTGRYGAVMTCK